MNIHGFKFDSIECKTIHEGYSCIEKLTNDKLKYENIIDITNIVLNKLKSRSNEIENILGSYIIDVVNVKNRTIVEEFKHNLDDPSDFTLPWPPNLIQMLNKWKSNLTAAAIQFHRNGELAELELLNKLSKRARREKNEKYEFNENTMKSKNYKMVPLGRANDIYAFVYDSVKGKAVDSNSVKAYEQGTTIEQLFNISYSTISTNKLQIIYENSINEMIENSIGELDIDLFKQIEIDIKKFVTTPWYMPSYAEPYDESEINTLLATNIGQNLIYSLDNYEWKKSLNLIMAIMSDILSNLSMNVTC